MRLRFCLIWLGLIGKVILNTAQQHLPLTGLTVGQFPWFTHVHSFNSADAVYLAVDPAVIELSGENLNVYICEKKTAAEWQTDPALSDVRSSGPQSHLFTGTSLSDAYFQLVQTDELETETGHQPGHGYCIIIDRDGNAQLSAADLVDGISTPGLYMVGDLCGPGPLEVDTLTYSSGFYKTFKLYWPHEIAAMDAQPLVIISHGWTYEYSYYHTYAMHLASRGYVVMCHRSDVGQGNAAATQTAAQTLLDNMDELLSNQSNIANGQLQVKIDFHRMVFIGHSTGGEAVVRARKRLADGDYISPFVTGSDVALVIGFAPVAFHNGSAVNPGTTPFHLFIGGADSDAAGSPTDTYQVTASIYERATGPKHLTYLHGCNHRNFQDNEDTYAWQAGPNPINWQQAQSVIKPLVLASCEWYTRGNRAMWEYLVRDHMRFRPACSQHEVVVSSEYRPALNDAVRIIDNFQDAANTAQASGGAAVSHTMSNLNEVEMRDTDGSFDWTGFQWSNGMVRARFNDSPRCGAMTWTQDNSSFSYHFSGVDQNWSAWRELQYRVCQLTRHPLTYGLQGNVVFRITLTDAQGHEASVSSEVYGDVWPPYERSNGGYGQFCLPEGQYTVSLGGGMYDEEVSFTIPGFLNGNAGTYSLVIPAGEPCTQIEVWGYDSWSDGWNGAVLTITNTEGLVVGTVEMWGGASYDTGYGWQNEFYTHIIPLSHFTSNGTVLSLEQITTLSFSFGESAGSPSGAIALDDVLLFSGELTTGLPSPPHLHHNAELNVWPNPASHTVWLQWSSLNEPWYYTVRDATGQAMLAAFAGTARTAQISVTGWPVGVYFIEAFDERGNRSCSQLVVCE